MRNEKMQKDHKRNNKRQDKMIYTISCYVILVKIVGDSESNSYPSSNLLDDASL